MSEIKQDLKDEKSKIEKTLSNVTRLFAESSKNKREMEIVYVETEADLQKALETISTHKLIGVDCEGVDLSRHGELCLIQISVPSKYNLFQVFVIDVVALGAKTFTSGLKTILEDSSVSKLFYDCRNDTDALEYQFKVRVNSIIDCQLLEVAHRRQKGQVMNRLPAYGVTFNGHFTYPSSNIIKIKGGMKDLYRRSPKVWRNRPLSKDLISYAAYDSVMLHLFNEGYKANLSSDLYNSVTHYANTIWANKHRDSKIAVLQNSSCCIAPTNREIGIKEVSRRRDLEDLFEDFEIC